MKERDRFFATSPKGIESLVADELKEIGASEIKITRAGVAFSGSLELAYKACLWLRTANRVLKPIASFQALDPEELYQQVSQIDWDEHLNPTDSLAVDFNSSDSSIKHTQYGAQKVKDGIVDQFRSRFGKRPSVNLSNPDLRINVYLLRDIATISIDLSGDSLHRRGYRQNATSAPLKENLAAAILMRANWPQIAKDGGVLIDPMCGSGTIPIEAALMAANSAPGLMREYYGFLKWKQHQPDLWEGLLDEAEQVEMQGLEKIPMIVGYDANSKSIANARENCEKAGLITKIHLEKREFATCTPHPKMKGKPGLVLFNPPYGVRLGEKEELMPLYSSIGEQLKNHFQTWRASVFTGNAELGKNIGIRATKKYSLFNGAIPCTLLNFEVDAKWFVNKKTPSQEFPRKRQKQVVLDKTISMFSNRIHKNLKTLHNWLKNNSIRCFRIYDKDIPDYAVCIDIYEEFAHVQEHKAPDTIDPKSAAKKLSAIMESLPMILDLPARNIYLKIREKQTGRNQYQKKQHKGEFVEVRENNCRFLVNFTDYLDTGLFLDHRITRQLIAELSKGKQFLNLFSYTGTATVYAAKGGATYTVSVDSSKHYNSWAKKNLALNGFSDSQHQVYEADCLSWMKTHSRRYDLIFIDPPTFSNSKDRKMIFEIQKDHVQLIQLATKLLNPNGVILFSNNFRKFKMDHDRLKTLEIQNITAETIPKDFKRNPKIHNCWKITKANLK